MTNRTSIVSGLSPLQVTETAQRTAALAGGVTLVDSTLAVAGAQTLSPSLLPSSVTFPALTVSYTVALAPGLLPSTTSVFPPAVSGVAQLLPGLLDSTNAFPAATVVGNTTLSPSLLPSGNQFFVPAVQGNSELCPQTLPSENQFFPPDVQGNNQLRPGILPSGNVFFPPQVSQPGATQVLLPGLLTSQSTFFAPAVGFAPPETIEPPVHWGGIGGPGGFFPVSREATAQGAKLFLKLVLEPGEASGVVSGVVVLANPDSGHPEIRIDAILGQHVPVGARVLGNSFGVRLALDQGHAFGVKDWRKYNEELLLLVA